jgi:hypothetical protein
MNLISESKHRKTIIITYKYIRDKLQSTLQTFALVKQVELLKVEW